MKLSSNLLFSIELWHPEIGDMRRVLFIPSSLESLLHFQLCVGCSTLPFNEGCARNCGMSTKGKINLSFILLVLFSHKLFPTGTGSWCAVGYPLQTLICKAVRWGIWDDISSQQPISCPSAISEIPAKTAVWTSMGLWIQRIWVRSFSNWVLK